MMRCIHEGLRHWIHSSRKSTEAYGCYRIQRKETSNIFIVGSFPTLSGPSKKLWLTDIMINVDCVNVLHYR